MAETTATKARAPRRSWPPAEKRRIVELTPRAGASVPAIAREHGVCPNSLHRWRLLYRTGKLGAPVQPAPRVAGLAASATFLPVSMSPEVPKCAGRSRLHALMRPLVAATSTPPSRHASWRRVWNRSSSAGPAPSMSTASRSCARPSNKTAGQPSTGRAPMTDQIFRLDRWR
jgi:transposase-like protein